MRIIGLFWAFMAPVILSAQTTEGTVVYNETIKMQIDFGDGPQAEEMRKMMPSSQTFQRILFFNETTSLYRNTDDGDNTTEMNHNDGEGTQMRIVMKQPENIIYRDLDKETSLEQRDLFGRNFLITNDSVKLTWKLTKETKKIGDYTCTKATLADGDTTRRVAAWFTTQIPTSTGPSEFCGLPGLILEADINDGERTLTAATITPGKVTADKMKKPKDGKKVTQAEFKTIEAEKMKEMEAEMGGSGGGMRVIIRND